MVTSPYDRHVGRYGAELAAGMVSLAGLVAGRRVLDVGSGTGELTVALSRAVGSEHVTAVDPSRPYAEVCRARVAGADVRIGRAESLPFTHDEFEAVFAQLVVNLLEDPAVGVAEMRRVAAPNGLVAACVWQAGAMPLLDAFWGAAAEVAGAEVAATPVRQRVGYETPSELAELFSGAGLAEVATSRLATRASYEDFDDLWAPFAAGVGRSGQICAGLAPDGQADLRARVHARLGAPAGAFELTAHAWAVTGRA